MPDRRTAQRARFFLLAALVSPLANAQSEALYRVEMIVFSQPSGAVSEQWDAIPDLDYPNRSRFLRFPGEQLSGQQQPEPMGIGAMSTPGDSAIGIDTAAANPASSMAFTTLPSSDRQFSGKAAAMQRSDRYQVLFHEAWIQPMAGQSETLPIVLDRSGDGGPWPMLQGSIKVYLSRYFYLETDLWLNTQGEYLQGLWRMPAPPLAPVSDAGRNAIQAPSRPMISSTSQAPSSQDTATAAQVTMQGEPMGQKDSIGPDYPYRHAVLLQQTRRMRSGEVAYMDHPLLAVLIKITPLAGTEGGQ